MTNLWVFSLIFLTGWLFNGCNEVPTAAEIVQQVILAHGGNRYKNSQIRFDFRGNKYFAFRKGGFFHYKKTFMTPQGTVVDELNNDGFIRSVNGQKRQLSAEDSLKYASSLNSVIYFALLPFPLSDPAVRLEYIGQFSLKNQLYFKIRVTFREEGGGKDYSDRFVYWIHQKRHTMDYLAYLFHVNEGGTRFREARNIRMVNGIRFADYINYEGPAGNTRIENFDRLFEAGKLQKLSEINLENIGVTTP